MPTHFSPPLWVDCIPGPWSIPISLFLLVFLSHHSLSLFGNTISIFQFIQAVMPTLPNLTVNSSTAPPSLFFISVVSGATAEVEPLRKLGSRFSHIYVQRLVTGDRPQDPESKIGLGYWSSSFQKQMGYFRL